jgi:hypothetical protein
MAGTSSAVFPDGVAHLMCLLRGQTVLLMRKSHSEGFGYTGHIWYGVLVVFRKR